MRNSVLIIVLFFGAFSSCGRSDLAILNEVNLFAPKWQEISQQYAFVKRNIGMALPLYEDHLQDLEPKIENANSSRRPELIGLRGRYQKMLREGQTIKGLYASEYETLKQTVTVFNDWQTRLMRNKLSNAEARADFATFKVKYREIKEQSTALQTSLIKNIENHNTLTAAMADLLNEYQSYKIETR